MAVGQYKTPLFIKNDAYAKQSHPIRTREVFLLKSVRG